jgi:hypothetical protein
LAVDIDAADVVVDADAVEEDMDMDMVAVLQ